MISRRVLLVLALLACSPLPARGQVVEQSGDWLLVCDEQANCTLVGTAAPDALPGYPHVELQISRGVEAEADLLLRSYAATLPGSVPGEPLTLDGLSLSMAPHSAPLATLRINPRMTGVPGYDYFTVEESAQVIAVLARDRPGYLRSGFGAFAALPQGDLARLLRRMDRVQAQAREAEAGADDGLSSAAAAYDLYPREQVEDVVDHPLLRRRCRDAPTLHARGYTLDHTTVPTLLVHVSCGGREQFYIWYPVGSAPPAPLTLARPRQRGASVTSASFDTEGGMLTLIDHPPGRTDCGIRTLWGWVDGEGMVLLSTWVMPYCRAIAPERWPQSFLGPRWMVW